VQPRYTTLRVIEAGVVLYDGHALRLAPEGGAARGRVDRFAATASPGVYALLDDGATLEARPRGGSALADGMPSRVLPSPVADRAGPFAKPAPPSPYDAVRRPGVATLLASPDGGELWESCVAALLAHDGARLVVVPGDRPRVASVAEAAIRAALQCREAPIGAAGGLPLLLVNALATCRPTIDGRGPFPGELARTIAELIESTAARP
jgi:hypothetical protein